MNAMMGATMAYRGVTLDSSRANELGTSSYAFLALEMLFNLSRGNKPYKDIDQLLFYHLFTLRSPTISRHPPY